MWILDFWVFDILLKWGCLLICMLDIRLLNCHPFIFFLGYKGGDCGPLSLSRTNREINITIIILVIGYLHVDDYFGYWILDILRYMLICDLVSFRFEYTLEFLDILVDILCIFNYFT